MASTIGVRSLEFTLRAETSTMRGSVLRRTLSVAQALIRDHPPVTCAQRSLNRRAAIRLLGAPFHRYDTLHTIYYIIRLIYSIFRYTFFTMISDSHYLYYTLYYII